jgi:tRNA 2-selenouridine synthase
VLDLEALAATAAQCSAPCRASRSQRRSAFDTRLWHALRRFDPARPVYVESESRKIGALRVPEPLLGRCAMHGQCMQLELPWPAR